MIPIRRLIREKRTAILVSFAANIGVAVGILQDPSQNTPARIEQNVGIPLEVAVTVHLGGALLLLMALKGRNLDLYFWGNTPIIAYAVFTVVGLFFGGTVLAVFLLGALVYYILRMVTTWED